MDGLDIQCVAAHISMNEEVIANAFAKDKGHIKEVEQIRAGLKERKKKRSQRQQRDSLFIF